MEIFPGMAGTGVWAVSLPLQLKDAVPPRGMEAVLGGVAL